jgi:iron complex transport system ATP-binding protein
VCGLTCCPRIPKPKSNDENAKCTKGCFEQEARKPGKKTKIWKEGWREAARHPAPVFPAFLPSKYFPGFLASCFKFPVVKQPILEVRGLTIWRGETTILDDLNWAVRSGEHWVILGANGSGKTSLLSALTGYLTPSDGTIHVLGQEFGESDWRELRQKIGMVSSSVRQLMHDEDTALEIVAGGAKAEIGFWGDIPKGIRAAARRVLKDVEAGYIAGRPWMVLSQGERQRVLIARALMAKPRLLILDEPCAGLDPVAREHFLAFVERMARSAKAPAIVLVTHHVEEITPAFTHALLLRAGRTAGVGKLQSVLTSAKLSEAFDAKMKVGRRAGRWEVKLQRSH